MGRHLVGVVAIAAATVAILIPSASALDRPQNFSLLDVSESFQEIGGFGFNRLPVAGDRFALSDGLYKWNGTKRGTRVGRLEAACMFTHILRAHEGNFSAFALCTGQFYLPAGAILAEGYVHFGNGPNNFRLAVIGGTGSYANARGVVHIRDLGTGDTSNSNVDFHLLP
jgi:hypothetical protein